MCDASCLPRKELYESWELARRVRRHARGGRVVDLCAGHGLLAHVMLLLDDGSPEALAVDTVTPKSAAKLSDALLCAWPRLRGRIHRLEASLDSITLGPDDVVVSAHACGALTDAVIERAVAARAKLAVLPCCHDAETCDTGGLSGWMDEALAIDATRAARLSAAGYTVRSQTIPDAITPKNRLLLAAPR